MPTFTGGYTRLYDTSGSSLLANIAVMNDFNRDGENGPWLGLGLAFGVEVGVTWGWGSIMTVRTPASTLTPAAPSSRYRRHERFQPGQRGGATIRYVYSCYRYNNHYYQL